MTQPSKQAGISRDVAIVVKVTWGAFKERLAVAAEVDGRWNVRFDTGLTYFDVDPQKFERLCSVRCLESLFSVLD